MAVSAEFIENTTWVLDTLVIRTGNAAPDATQFPCPRAGEKLTVQLVGDPVPGVTVKLLLLPTTTGDVPQLDGVAPTVELICRLPAPMMIPFPVPAISIDPTTPKVPDILGIEFIVIVPDRDGFVKFGALLSTTFPDPVVP